MVNKPDYYPKPEEKTMSYETDELLQKGSLIMGCPSDKHHIEFRGNIEIMRRDKSISQVLDNVHDVFSDAISQIMQSGDLEKLQLPTDDYIQLRMTIKNGKFG